MYPILEFDSNPAAIIEPSKLIAKRPDFPSICISTFSGKIIEKLSQMNGVTQICCIHNANGEIPIYQIDYENTPIAFYLSPIGSAAAAGTLEEIIALGANKFVFFGSCGVLNHEIVDGHIIVPTSAVRDEGTSYHYISPSPEITLSKESVDCMIQTLQQLDYPYTCGKVWSTDAFYRETPDKMQRRKQSGCIAVEMECSALAAVCAFRKVSFAQFLYAADNLDSLEWEVRGLSINQGLKLSDIYLKTALTCALHLK